MRLYRIIPTVLVLTLLAVGVNSSHAQPPYSVYLPIIFAADRPAPATPTPAPTATVEPTSVPFPTPEPIQPTFEHGGQVHGFGTNAVNAMNQANMGWVKHQVRWSPDSDLSYTGLVVQNAHDKGFKVLIGLLAEPRNGSVRADLFDEYAAFAAGLAGLGADAIEVHNEPNLTREWPTEPISPESYTSMLQQSYTAIKAANPNTMVISAAPAPTGYFGGGCTGTGCDDLPFIQRMKNAGAADYLDCVGVHYNEGVISPTLTTGDPRGGHYTRYFQGMRDTYAGVFPGKPLCFTEVGFLSGDGYGEVPAGFRWRSVAGQGYINMTAAEQAQYQREVRDIGITDTVTRLVIVWNIDFTYWGADDPQAGYAIIRPDGSCPACVELSLP